MKNLLLAFLLFFTTQIFAQTYSEVVPVEGRTAMELYIKAREWFAISFNSANDVIQMDDPANKKLIGKGVKTINYFIGDIPAYINVHFTLVVAFKDSRYKQEIKADYYSTAGNENYDTDALQRLATEEGLKDFYERMGVKPWIIGKKVIATTLEANKKLIIDIDTQLKDVLQDLKRAMTEKEPEENW